METKRRPELRVGPDVVQFQLVEGLRFTITAQQVREQRQEAVPTDVAAAQRAGPVWAFQRHLRRQVVLHASALLLGSSAFLFAAASGTGKSTLGTQLRRRGWGFLSDDLASIRLRDDGPWVEAGPPHIRLWPDAHRWADLPRDEFRLLVEGMDKLIADRRPDAHEARLAGVFFLQREGTPGIHGMSPTQSLMALVEQTYVYQNYRSWCPDWPAEPWHFHACSAIARAVPSWRLVVGQGLERVPHAAMLAETTATATLGSGAAPHDGPGAGGGDAPGRSAG